MDWSKPGKLGLKEWRKWFFSCGYLRNFYMWKSARKISRTIWSMSSHEFSKMHRCRMCKGWGFPSCGMLLFVQNERDTHGGGRHTLRGSKSGNAEGGDARWGAGGGGYLTWVEFKGEVVLAPPEGNACAPFTTGRWASGEDSFGTDVWLQESPTLRQRISTWGRDLI